MAVVVLCGLATAVATAQGGKSKPPQAAAGARDYHVVALKYQVANDLASVLERIVAQRAERTGEERKVSIVADPRNNALILQAPPDELEPMRKLIGQLDTAGPEEAAAAERVMVFALKNRAPDKFLLDALSLVHRGGGNSIAVDPQLRTIIATGTHRTLQEIEKLIECLDRKPIAETGVDKLKVRIAWLVSAEKLDKLSPAPDDLKDAVAELAKLSIKNPSLAAQIVVNTMPDAEFRVDGQAVLDLPIHLAMVGKVRDGGDRASLDIAINASRVPGAGFGGKGKGGFPGGSGFGAPARDAICSLQTTVNVPWGQTVVLGVTPAEGITSAFVVQVLRK